MNWKQLERIEDLDALKNESEHKRIVIFKHSTRCYISKMVKSKFEVKFENTDAEADFYYLDLIRFRNVSNEIASAFNVVHQSPQVLVLRNGVMETHASHYDILTDISL